MSVVRIVAIAVAASFVLTGCGETWGGVKKDTGRIFKGIKTIFVSEG